MTVIRKWVVGAFSQLTWAEVSGSLGDLGTFLPLLIALVQKVQLDLGTTLIVTGLYNIASGVQFGIPMCVQPMKTIAAVALAASQPALTLPQLLLAGVFVSGCVLLLGLSRLIDVFNWLVPPPVVRGVQLAVGAKLAMKGVEQALRVRAAATPGSAAPPPPGPTWRPWLGSEGLLVGLMALGGLIATTMASAESAPGSPEAADDGALGPRPTDTPLEPLIWWLARGRSGNQSTAEAAEAAVEKDEHRGGGGGGGGGGGSTSANCTETSRLLGGSGRDGGDDCGAADLERATSAAAAAPPPPPPRASSAVAAMGACGLDRQTVGGGYVGSCGGGGSGVRQFPSALVAVVVGLVMAVVSNPGMLGQLKVGPSTPRLLRPSWSDFTQGALRAGLPQLPLTTLNSVIAVSHLAGCLFPERRDSARWRPAAVALSVALMNLGGCWLGAMPCCHGAGGLAAQYKFGARSGAAPVLLGCLKSALGLLFGSSLGALLAAFPQPLLGALLVVSGVELASSVRHTRTPRGYSFALLTAVAILGLDDTGTGFLLGLAAVVVVALYDRTVSLVHGRWLARRQ